MYSQDNFRKLSESSGPSIGIQSVLYNSDIASLKRSISAAIASVTAAKREGRCKLAKLYYGDCSPQPCLSSDDLECLRRIAAGHIEIEYHFFNDNLGSACGHNRLSDHNDCDSIVIMNPDILMSSGVIATFVRTLMNVSRCGQVEARQVPIEHPKAFDDRTGATSWASTSCCIVPRELFQQVGRFDAENFFLYGDDVDYSWRTRLAGFGVIYQPAAFVFHDKRLSQKGGWQVGAAEQYYSAESALLLTYKWSRYDITKRYLTEFLTAGGEHHRKARSKFLERMAEGNLPPQLDTEHKIGQFINYAYAEHRYKL